MKIKPQPKHIGHNENSPEEHILLQISELKSIEISNYWVIDPPYIFGKMKIVQACDLRHYLG